MAPGQKGQEEGKCSHMPCGKPAVQKCGYCGEGFCREHLRAKPTSLLSILQSDELSERTKRLIEKERNIQGGHQCTPYFDSLKEGRETGERGRARFKAAAMRRPRQPRSQAIKKRPARHGYRKYIIACVIVVLAALSIFYFRDTLTPFMSSFMCPDGTLYDACSMDRPYYCSDGRLVERAAICGCQDGYVPRGELCVTPEICTDNTKAGECSLTRPLYCEAGSLINKASLCGCPERGRPDWTNYPPAWNISSPVSMSNPRWYTNRLTFSMEGNCSATQRDKMLESMSYLVKNTRTSLNFAEVTDGCPDIIIRCAGPSVVIDLEEGIGEANVTYVHEGYYSVITKAELQFPADDNLCSRPVVQLHELLHAFGFKHSSEPTDIMYIRFGCLQDIRSGMKSDLAQIYPPLEYAPGG